MNLGEQYIEQLNAYNALAEKERAIQKVKKGIENQMLKTKQALIDAHFDDGECFDDLGIHIRKVKPKLVVTDMEKLPRRFFRTEEILLKKELNEHIKDNGLIEGVTLDNGGHTIQLITKGK